MQLIDGKQLAENIKKDIAHTIHTLGGPRPNLAIILVGDRPDSQLYVSLKEKQAKAVGIDTHLYKCEAEITEQELLDMINFLNKDRAIDAILVQLPLPEHISTHKIIEALDPQKDIDGFHSYNLARLNNETADKIIPPVYGVIITMLQSINYDLTGKQVCLIAKADIFENNLADLLQHLGAQVSLTKITDGDLSDKTRRADVLITAVGQPGYITAEMIKDQAVIIDIGITKINGEVKGDVDFASVQDKAGYLTPVPGGVGPLTIAMAFANTLQVFKQQRNESS